MLLGVIQHIDQMSNNEFEKTQQNTGKNRPKKTKILKMKKKLNKRNQQNRIRYEKGNPPQKNPRNSYLKDKGDVEINTESNQMCVSKKKGELCDRRSFRN